MENKATKKCPHCGKEILSVAKKCKYCGEWIEETSGQTSGDNEKNYSPEVVEKVETQDGKVDRKRKIGKKGWILLALLGILCCILLFFSPISPWGGNSKTQISLGNYYYSHNNPEKAFKWYKKAAENGNIEAQKITGWCLFWGEGTLLNDTASFNWFMKAANQGDVKAKHYVACYYLNGLGVKQDYNQAYRWYKEAASQNFPLSQFCMGVCALNGYGTEVNERNAMDWFQKASANGCPEAQFILGSILYKKGKNDKANELFMKAAGKGLAEALPMVKAIQIGKNNELDKIVADNKEIQQLLYLLDEIDILKSALEDKAKQETIEQYRAKLEEDNRMVNAIVGTLHSRGVYNEAESVEYLDAWNKYNGVMDSINIENQAAKSMKINFEL